MGHSSNTSTPKHPDSTSAKKPSSSKEPTPNDQEKSPRSCGSRKHSCSPSLSAESVRCKWKGVCTEDTHTLNSTLPISSSAFDSLCSPMGSQSDVTELQPPSITSTPLGLGTPRQWQTTSEESGHSLASLYTNPNFNFPGHLIAGPSNLTPSIPSLARSHHVSSTWPASVFTSGPSSHHLTIDQANNLFKLAAKCQVLGIKLAKQFQVLFGLEAMHCNSIQGTEHETLTLERSAWEATYSVILQDRVSGDECETTTHHLHSEADAAWKEMHEVMYNHQLQQLAAFLMEAEAALSDMRGEVWVTVHALAENEGITFNACLGIPLQVFNLLLQLPIDISFQTQIPLTIAYCPELGGLPANQVKVVVASHLLLHLTTLQDLVDHWALDVDLVAMHKVSLLSARGNQALWAQWLAIIPFVPMLLKMARCTAVSLSPPTMREMVPQKMAMPKKTRVGSRPQVLGRWHWMIKKGRSTLMPKAPSPVLVRSVDIRTQTPERKSSPPGESSTQKAQRRTAPEGVQRIFIFLGRAAN